MSRYDYDNLVSEMRARNNDEKKQFIDRIGIGQLLDCINQAAQTAIVIKDRIDTGRKIYDRAAGQKKVIEVLGLLPESERVRFIAKVSFQFRGYLRVAELSGGELGRSLYFDVFNGGELTTAWGGFSFFGIDYDWDNFLKRAGNYVRHAEESRFGYSKKEWFDAILTFIPEDSMGRFIDAVDLETYAKINKQTVRNSISHTSAFFRAAVTNENESQTAASFASDIDALLRSVIVPAHPILEGLIVPSHRLAVTGVVVEEEFHSSDIQMKL